MTRGQSKLGGGQARRRLLASIATLAMLFVIILGFGVLETFRQSEEVANARTRIAAKAAVDGNLRLVRQLAGDNAYWDEAVRAAYSPSPDESFIYDSWGAITAESPNYETAFIIDAKRKVRFAYERNERVQFDAMKRYGRALDRLLSKLDNGRDDVSGLARFGKEIVFIGAANIIPTDEGLKRMIPAAGPDKLVFVKRLSPTTLAEIGRQIVVKRPMLMDQPDSENGIVLWDAQGKKIGHLAWTSSVSFREIAKRLAPSLMIGAILYAIILIVCISHATQGIQMLTRLAMTDGLSGLPNRRALKRKLAELPPHEKVALAFLDLDGFKAVNDNYGHEVGDQLIKLVSGELLSMLKPGEMVARLGGDEFALQVTGKDCQKRLEELAEQVLNRFAQPFAVEDRVLVVGSSLGLSAARVADISATELMRRADVAMYSAKEAGKMRAFWFDERLDEEHAAMHRMAMALRSGLADGELSVVYQPIMDIGGERIAAVEALVRWASPTLGQVSPDKFIPVAEESGLIDAIGQFVLRRACEEMRDCKELKLAINVSAAQLRHPLFVDNLATVLTETGFPAARLEIEITETYIIRETQAAIRILTGLRAIGVTIALDDFGTGFASIGFLRQFPFTKLKIDRSLVHEATRDEASRTLVQASVATARVMNMVVAAEGIEDQDQAELMRIAGCDQLQGWLYGHPMVSGEVLARLDQSGRQSRHMRA